MKNPYKLIKNNDPRLKKFEDYYDDDDDSYYNYSVLVKVDSDDNIEEVIGNDCCEPEDATLFRKFSWVINALNKLHNDNVDKIYEKYEKPI